MIDSEFNYFQNLLFDSAMQKPLSSGERVYHNGYRARIVSVLGKYLPSTQFLLGEILENLILRFLDEKTPGGHNLDSLPEQFMHFFKSDKMEYDFGAPKELFLDLIQFEIAMNEAMIAPDNNTFDTQLLSSWSADDWETQKIPLAKSTKLLKLNFPVGELIEPTREAVIPPIIGAQETQYVLYRKNFSVHWMTVDLEFFNFLELQNKTSLAEAAITLQTNPQKLSELINLLLSTPSAFSA